ncbi:hypothetical protein ACFQ4O_05555, partial [Methylopila musalis]
RRRGRLAADTRALYAVNLLGVAGAFTAGFTSLQAGLLSNVGSAVIYARHASGLARLTNERERRAARLLASIYG